MHSLIIMSGLDKAMSRMSVNDDRTARDRDVERDGTEEPRTSQQVRPFDDRYQDHGNYQQNHWHRHDREESSRYRRWPEQQREYRPIEPPRWRQPVYHPTSRKEEMIARDRMRPLPLGGKSKKDALGSVAESWGPIESRPYGMFEIEDDPPSRSTSPFRIADPVDEKAEAKAQQIEQSTPSRYEIKSAKKEALEMARKGTPFQR